MASTLPRVSIITVVYNDLAGLQHTAASVAAQTYPNIEWVVVDGASTDGTREWIAANTHRMGPWLSEPDKGIYDAMNKGLALATGHYVWFLNAGDLAYADHTLQHAITALADADVYYGDTALMNGQGQVIGLRDHKKLPRQLSWRHLRIGMVVCHQALIVRRSLALPYDASLRIAADIDWAIRVLRQARSICNTRQIICKFETGGASARRWRLALRERFGVLRRHYGLPITLLSHGEILLRALWRRMSGQPRKALSSH